MLTNSQGDIFTLSSSLWIFGSSRSGKSTRLVEQFCSWIQSEKKQSRLKEFSNTQYQDLNINQTHINQAKPGILVLSANNDNRQQFADKMTASVRDRYPIKVKTPLGFFQDEVMLFWPLLIQSLQITAQFPVRLRPETEQELATKLWRSHLDGELLRSVRLNEYRLVRRILDLMQLAAYSGTPLEDVGKILTMSLSSEEDFTSLDPELLSSLIQDWRKWCLDRGLLTYGIITQIYHQYLLSDVIYLSQLQRRYQALVADDVQDYPAIARHLFETLLDRGCVGAFSYNPDSKVRLGLGADPEYMRCLSERCQIENLKRPILSSLADTLREPMVSLATDPMQLVGLPDIVKSIQTTSRAELLKQTAQEAIAVIKSGEVQPQDIAIIAPGLDAIARYTLVDIFSKENIPVDLLKDQRPLVTSPAIRALLTVLAFVYPGLGRLIDRDAIAQMLVVLSRKTQGIPNSNSTSSTTSPEIQLTPEIDPARAGLIADYCFDPHPEQPQLLPVTAFERWDRLGYAATVSYEKILQWLKEQRSQQQQRLIPSPISLIDRTIQRFLWNGSNLPYEQLAALRELLETAQHYWEIDTRIQQFERTQKSVNHNIQKKSTQVISQEIKDRETQTIAEFIQLLRCGTITANPYPVKPMGLTARAVTISTIYQYRVSRKFHPWHFWLDAGSPLWSKAGAATLFGAPFFLKDRLGEPWTAEDETLAEAKRIQDILSDLLARVSEKVYLCHSDLATNGQDQLGPLLPLVQHGVPVPIPTNSNY
ncbi:MAG: recombinase family protein [Cyanobacteria bacterium P01_A01_bin.84]